MADENTHAAAPEEGGGFTWRVTLPDHDGINIQAGKKLSKFTTETQLYIIGKSLIDLGTRLLTSTASDDNEAEWVDEV